VQAPLDHRLIETDYRLPVETLGEGDVKRVAHPQLDRGRAAISTNVHSRITRRASEDSALGRPWPSASHAGARLVLDGAYLRAVGTFDMRLAMRVARYKIPLQSQSIRHLARHLLYAPQ